MNRCSRLLVLAGSLLAATAAHATYYYFSNSGNDKLQLSDMNQNNPWQSIKKANSLNLVHGDRIYLSGGSNFNDAGLALLGPNDAGTAADPIIVDSYGTGQATITPPAGDHGINIYNTGGIVVRNIKLVGPGSIVSTATPSFGVSLWCDQTGGVKYAALRFENLTISNFYRGLVVDANAASFSGFKDVTVIGCTVSDCVSDGIVTHGVTLGASATKQSHQNLQILNTTVSTCKGDGQNTTDHSGSGIIMAGTLGGLIDQCVAHDCGGSSGKPSGGGPVGIWCWGCNAVTIQHCLVYNQKTTPNVSDGGGFDIDGGATNCIIQYCYSYNNDGPGFEAVEFSTATPLTNATIRYNISWKDGRHSQASLSVWNGTTNAANCTDIKFYNNIVVAQDVSSAQMNFNPAIGYPLYSGPVGVKFYNNIVYALGTSKLVDLSYNTSSFTFKGNSYYSASATPKWTWGATTYTTLAAWQAATGTPEKNGSTSVGYYGDPLMANPATGAAPTTVGALAGMTAFIPSSTTVVKDKGQNLTTSTYGSLSVGTVDFKGSPIPVNAYDIGAYEK